MFMVHQWSMGLPMVSSNTSPEHSRMRSSATSLLQFECLYNIKGESTYLGALDLGLRALNPTTASPRVAWQGAFGVNRTRTRTRNLGYVCSVVAWLCPVRSYGSCRLDRMLYTIGVMLHWQALLHLEGRTSIHPCHHRYHLAVPDKSIRVHFHRH